VIWFDLDSNLSAEREAATEDDHGRASRVGEDAHVLSTRVGSSDSGMFLSARLVKSGRARKSLGGEQNVDAVVTQIELLAERGQEARAHRCEQVTFCELVAHPTLGRGGRDEMVRGESNDCHRRAGRRREYLDASVGRRKHTMRRSVHCGGQAVGARVHDR
jgi:hypothetical protein